MKRALGMFWKENTNSQGINLANHEIEHELVLLKTSLRLKRIMAMLLFMILLFVAWKRYILYIFCISCIYICPSATMYFCSRRATYEAKKPISDFFLKLLLYFKLCIIHPMSLPTRWGACWRGWRGWGRRGGHHRVSYLQPHTDGKVICVFVFNLCLSLSLSLSVSLPMLSKNVSATASYRCKDA